MRIIDRLSFLLVLWLFLGYGLVVLPSSNAQTVTLRGFVTSSSDGQPMPGVNVTLTTPDGVLLGAATDSDGFYAISRIPIGEYILRVTFIGFEPIEEPIAFEVGMVTKNIELSESETQLDEVLVESERESAGAANVLAGLQTVRPADIDLIPAPDISADLVNYLTSLPGIVSQGDRGGQLFIRGGEPTQNLVLLDGMLIYQPFHIVGFFSAFPSDIINTADVYAGGFGSQYGGRLSSVIDVSARTGNKRRFAGAVSLAPFVSTVRLEGPLVRDKVSLLFSARQSVLEQGASRLIDEPLPFDFGDIIGKLHANLGASTQLSVTGIHTDDRGRLGLNRIGDVEAITEDEVSWQNDAIGGRMIFLPATLPVFAEILISQSKLTNEFGPADKPVRKTEASRFSFAVNLTHYVGTSNFNWGLFLNSSQLSSDLGGLFQNIDTKREFVTEVGAYFEPEFKPAEGISIRPGLRLQTFPSQSESFLEPRLRVILERGIHRFSGAVGIYHQEITGLNDRRDAGDVFTAWTVSPFGVVPEAKHAIVGYRIRPSSWLTLSAEGFYKDLKNLIVPEWTAFPRFTTSVLKADGTAKGLDFRMEIKAGSHFQATISYGKSEVIYRAGIEALEILTGDVETEYSPPHDRKDQVNVMTNVSFAGFNLNVRWQFGSGLPFNQSLGFDRFVLLDSLVNVAQTPGDERVLYGRPYTGRLPTYHRLDVSLDREFTLKGGVAATIQAGLINAYDRNNLFYLDLFTLRRVDQLPLIPTVGIKLEFK
jgi:CarboxypepD_reg-like domain/TonB-dependent Receptor Plug Domain